MEEGKIEPEEKPETAEAADTPETPETAKEPEAAETPETAEGAAKPAAPETPEEPPKAPDWKDMYARLMADFDNFKKRTQRDREDTYRFAESDILGDILPSVDNLALAIAKAPSAEDPFVKGVQLVYDALLAALKEHGAEPFNSVGKPLDTDKMEAIATLPDANFDEGVVSNEVKKGWMLRGKTLRAAQVVVSSGKANG